MNAGIPVAADDSSDPPGEAIARISFAILLALVVPVTANAEAIPEPEREEREGRTSYFVYVGQFSATRFNQIVRFDTDFQDSWIGVLGVNRHWTNWGNTIRWEWEANVGQHWGRQSHQEVNGGIVLRWIRFPWDEYLDTSFAVGSGLSFAFKRPPIEETIHHPPERLLKYMLFELEATRPGWGDWSGFIRIHHRSGVFGLLSDARGSNFVGLGLRRRF